MMAKARVVAATKLTVMNADGTQILPACSAGNCASLLPARTAVSSFVTPRPRQRTERRSRHGAGT